MGARCRPLAGLFPKLCYACLDPGMHQSVCGTWISVSCQRHASFASRPRLITVLRSANEGFAAQVICVGPACFGGGSGLGVASARDAWARGHYWATPRAPATLNRSTTTRTAGQASNRSNEQTLLPLGAPAKAMAQPESVSSVTSAAAHGCRTLEGCAAVCSRLQSSAVVCTPFPGRLSLTSP